LHKCRKGIIIKNVKFLQIFYIRRFILKEKISIIIADDNKDFAMTLLNYLDSQEDMEIIGVAQDRK